MLKVRFANSLDPGSGGYYISYNHKKVSMEAWKYCDIRKFIVSNQKQWLLQIEQWHANLCQVASNIIPYWWLVPGSRFHVWEPPIYNPIIFVVAVLDYCKVHNIRSITLLSCPAEVVDYFKEMQPDLDYIVDNNNKFEQLLPISHIKQFIVNLVRWLFLFLGSFKNVFRKSSLKKIIKDKRTFVFSKKSGGEVDRNRPDHFFGNMLDYPSFKDEKKILWICLTNRIININFKKIEGKDHLIISELVSPVDVIAILWIWIKIACNSLEKKLPLFTIGSYTCSKFSNNFYSYLIKNRLPLTELQVLFAFKKLLSQSGSVKNIYYPYEEKTIERGILKAVEIQSKNIKTVGYSHSIHNNLHMYYRKRSDALANSPKPQLYTVTGNSEKKWLLREAEIDEDKVVIVGSSRYVDLLPSPSGWKNAKSKLKVLILVGQAYEMKILANLLDELEGVFNDCELLIRKYPFGWSSDQDEGIERIQKHVSDIRIDNKEKMEKQIEWCDVAIFNSTSSGIISMLYGRISVYVELHDLLYLDPMDQKFSDSVIRCKTAKEMKLTLNKVRNLSIEEYLNIANNQRKFALQIYSPPNKAVLNKILS